uniref:Eukaryotic translation initiation factor 2D n=1 Tax=Astyanax mexicanus TaxID=7994 RepID=A0A8B9GVU3_ASTMX
TVFSVTAVMHSPPRPSCRRKLRADISAAFPSLSADDLNELVPNKEELNVVKIYAHKGEAVTLYVIHKNPMFFQMEKQLYPTVYTLWRYPDMLAAFTTWAPVVQKLMGGADLMLPGVVVSSAGLPDVKKGDCCAVNIVSNRAPVAVGTAAMSSSDMRSTDITIDCVHMLVLLILTRVLDLFTEQMDSLLYQCFLHALKATLKKSELPLLTGTFLRKHMVSCCPKGKHIDIKKSSYKKFSKFLQTMQKEHSLVQVKELSKGVDSIVEVDWKNSAIRSFCVPEDWEPSEESGEQGESCEVVYHPPEITPLYGVTARLQPLFQDTHQKKGAVLQASEVRTIITDYVKRNELVHETNKSYVKINPILCDCLLEKSEYQDVEVLKWDDLFSRTLNKMQACHQLLFPGQPPVVKKGQVEPIDVSVASRGSNKKVLKRHTIFFG